MEKSMRKLGSILMAAMIASTAFTTTALIVPGDAEAASKAYCRTYAKKQANRRTRGGDVLAGAAIGAGLGALTGAIIGGKHSVGRGAIIGGVGGTVVGGVSTNDKWHRRYNNAYAFCRSEL
jgi:integral membrane sensor domain MASE1